MAYETENFDFDWNHQTGVSMDDVGGMEDLKNTLTNEVIRPLTTHQQKAAKLGIDPPNILFYGPPGTGKTHIAKALATELGLPFVKLSGSDIQSKWINESAQEVQRLFTEAEIQARKEGGALIFLDELDSVLKSRGGSNQHDEDGKVVNEFLNHLEETTERNVVFIGATNRLEDLDDAATRSGRIDRKIEIGLPDSKARKNILEAQLRQRSYKIAEENLEALALNAEGYSAADLEGVVENAARNAAFERNADVIILEDIEAADATLVEETDPDLSADKEVNRSVDNHSGSVANQPQQQEEFESLYRVVGFGDEARRMALYDLPRDDTVWVNTVGYDDPIRSQLEELDSGNLVEAAVTHQRDRNEYWDLLEFEIVGDEVLYYIPTDGYVPGPTDEFWDERADGGNTVSAGHSDDEGNVLYEIQLQSKEVTTEDGEVLEVYPNLQRGELLTEPQFEGNGCDHLEGGAEAILIVNPEGKEYLVMYLFPEKNESFNEIWGALYDYVEG